MKLIDISTPKFPNTFAMVDDEDFERLNQWKWYAKKGRRTIYAARTTYNCGKRKELQIHTTLMSPPPGMLVDHANSNGLDNRRANLRIASHSQNQANKRKQPGTNSTHKGVFIDKRSNRWMAIIKFEKKTYYLGTFQSEHDAAMAYNTAAIKHFGEFAILNKINPNE